MCERVCRRTRATRHPQANLVKMLPEAAELRIPNQLSIVSSFISRV